MVSSTIPSNEVIKPFTARLSGLSVIASFDMDENRAVTANCNSSFKVSTHTISLFKSDVPTKASGTSNERERGL